MLRELIDARIWETNGTLRRMRTGKRFPRTLTGGDIYITNHFYHYISGE